MGLFNNLINAAFGRDSRQDAAPEQSSAYETSGTFEGHDLDAHGNLVTDSYNTQVYENYLQNADQYTANPYYQRGEPHHTLVNPYQVQGIDLLGSEDSFWNMTLQKNGLTKEESINIASRLPDVNQALSVTNDPEERSQIIGKLMQSDDPELAKCAAAYFSEPNDFPEAVKIGNVYENQGNGRHREVSAMLAADRAREEAYANGQPFDPDTFSFPVNVSGEQVAPGQVPVPPQYSKMLPAENPAQEQDVSLQEQSLMSPPDLSETEAVPLDQLPTRTPVLLNPQEEGSEPNWVQGIEAAMPEPSLEPAFQTAPIQEEEPSLEPAFQTAQDYGESTDYSNGIDLAPTERIGQGQDASSLTAGFEKQMQNALSSYGEDNSVSQDYSMSM